MNTGYIKDDYRPFTDEKQMKEVWEAIQSNGLPLLAEGVDVRLFIGEFWTLDMLNTQVLCTYKTKPVARMNLSKAILNMLLINTLDRFGIEFDKKYIFTDSGNLKSQEAYSQMVMNDAFEMGENIFTVRELVGSIKECFVQLTWVLDNKLLKDISILDIFDLCDADETLKKWILDGPYEEGMSIYDAEMKKAECLEYLEKVVNEKNIQPLKSLLAAGVGVRLPQMADCLFMIASRPDDDTVLPHIHFESWLRGVESRDTFYNESYIARRANLITKIDIKDPGSFQKNVSYLNNPSYLNEDEDYMCDTKHFITYEIKTQEDLDKLNDRYMIIDGDMTNLKVIDKNDKSYIGQTVNLRSPYYCNSKVGVCRYCTGENMYRDNVKGPKDSESNLAVIFVKKYIGPKGQDFLSGKHNMITNILNAIFGHDRNIEIRVKDTDVIYSNGTIVKSEEYLMDNCKDENYRGKLKYYGFNVVYNNVSYPVECDSVITFDDDDRPHVTYGNNRKSKAYIEIKHVFYYPNEYGDLISRLNRILGSDYIVAEMLLRNMVVTAGKSPDERERPDWSKEDIGPTEYLCLTSAIVNNTGVVNKFPFGYFGDVVSNPDNYKPVPAMPYDVLYMDRRDLSDIEE